MPVYKYLDLSITHLTEKDVDIIMSDLNDGDNRKLIGCDREYGFWLHVCAEPNGSELDKLELEKFKKLGLSSMFLKCYEEARKQGCYWMLFDTDADEHEGLPIREQIEELQIWDNGGETYDRYTAVWPDGSYLGMSEHPFHPQGFGQHGEGGEYYGDCPEECHLGKSIEFNDLPEDCQKCVLQDLRED